MLLVHFKKAFPLTLLGHSLKKGLTAYCFILKVTRVFPYSYTGKVDEEGEDFADNDQN